MGKLEYNVEIQENTPFCMSNIFEFYKNKKILITGHTGFKGAWLSQILINAGAEVVGYSLEPPTNPNLYELIGLKNRMRSIIGDIRDFDNLLTIFSETQPEIVFHLAAQPIVLDSYNNPRSTFEINVMGTVNLLESVRMTQSVRSVVNITTDKVYKNNEWFWGYREDDLLGGYDPYSNSKSCSELVTASYIKSFFNHSFSPAISTARAGNVIGGGDFARNRIIPDCVRCVTESRTIEVRNPQSTRPYQHVLDALSAYLLIAQKQYEDKQYADSYNIGPDESGCMNTGDLVDLFCETWGQGAKWKKSDISGQLHESNFLRLDCSKIKNVLGWKPHWNISESMEMVCRFMKVWMNKGDILEEMDREINELGK